MVEKSGHGAELLAWVSVGVFLGLGIYTFQYAEGLSYLSNDPKACVNCHVMREQYAGWLTGSHHGRATCNDCHIPHHLPAKLWIKMENGWRHSIKFTFRSYEKPIRIRPANLERVEANCILCHELRLSRMPDHPVKVGDGTRCTECHVSIGHMTLN